MRTRFKDLCVISDGPNRFCRSFRRCSARHKCLRTEREEGPRCQGGDELREVETGWQDDGRVEIKHGLSADERVVTTGAFLLDSESRLKRTPQTR